MASKLLPENNYLAFQPFNKNPNENTIQLAPKLKWIVIYLVLFCTESFPLPYRA